MKQLYIIFRMFKCPHKWQESDYYQVVDRWDDIPVAYKYKLTCSKCGNIKFKKTK